MAATHRLAAPADPVHRLQQRHPSLICSSSLHSVHGTKQKKTKKKRNIFAVKQIQKEIEIDMEKEEIKSTVVCVFFSFLQVTGNLTAGRKVKRGGSHSRSPCPMEFLAAACEPTRR
jgi:hypothetical protein